MERKLSFVEHQWLMQKNLSEDKSFDKEYLTISKKYILIGKWDSGRDTKVDHELYYDKSSSFYEIGLESENVIEIKKIDKDDIKKYKTYYNSIIWKEIQNNL